MDDSREQDRRQYPRTRVSWSILVNTEAGRFLSRSLDIGPFGAKVRTKERLKMGTLVRLEVVPPDGPRLHIGATVWRVDADGLAFLFSTGIQHHLIRGT